MTYRILEPQEIEVHGHGCGALDLEAGEEVDLRSVGDDDDPESVLVRDGLEYDFDRRAWRRAVEAGQIVEAELESDADAEEWSRDW